MGTVGHQRERCWLGSLRGGKVSQLSFKERVVHAFHKSKHLGLLLLQISVGNYILYVTKTPSLH